MKKKRVFILFVVIALVGAGIVAATARAQTGASTTATETGKVTQATLSSVVESSGSVTPKAESALSFGVSSTDSKVNVKVGDRVKQGEVLAELDTTDLELAVAQAEQAYLSQQAAYSLTVNLDPTDAPLKLDMTANASLIGERHENVLAVPTKAIRSGRAANQAAMQTGQTMTTTTTSNMGLVLQDGRARPVPVTVGMTANDLTEVSGDLQEGDQVLVATTTTGATTTQDFGGPPDGGLGGPPPF